MDVENMQVILETLTARVRKEVEENLDRSDSCEMSQIIDMVKDVSEAMYYRKMAEHMEDTVRLNDV